MSPTLSPRRHEVVRWCQKDARKVPDCFLKESDGVRKVSDVVRKV